MALPGYKLELYDPYADSTNEILYLIIIFNLTIWPQPTTLLKADLKLWMQKKSKLLQTKNEEYFEMQNSFAISFNLVYDNRVIKIKLLIMGMLWQYLKHKVRVLEMYSLI